MNFAAMTKWVLIMTLSSLFSIQSFAISGAELDAEKQAISDRIKPVGEVCIEGGEGCADAQAKTPVTAAPATTPATSVSSSAKSGETIYNSHCSVCHGSGVAGAPMFGDKAAWSPRIAKGKETLYKHALEGFNAMPAKGMCADCSDDEIKATVDYMVSKSK